MKTTTLAELLAEETPEFREAVRKEADAMRMEMNLGKADKSQAELARELKDDTPDGLES